MRLIRFRQVRSSARIYVADDFIDDREIDYLLTCGEAARQTPERAPAAKHDFTGFSFEMPLGGNPIARAISARMEAAFGIRNKQPYSMRFRRYHPEEYHPLHYDNYEITGSFLVLTAMMWLANTEQGGETRFPYSTPAPVALEPRRGRLAIWLNYLADGSIDSSATHEALPVQSGTKITLTNFVYANIDAVPRFAAQLQGETDISGVRFE